MIYIKLPALNIVGAQSPSRHCNQLFKCHLYDCFFSLEKNKLCNNFVFITFS